ncbi:MAG: AMIN domain-containing protein [Hydrococcus sp. RU_2_2]|nr:AMIN domain-containing protein [Hydrococcus sp. RU_2_2]
MELFDSNEGLIFSFTPLNPPALPPLQGGSRRGVTGEEEGGQEAQTSPTQTLVVTIETVKINPTQTGFEVILSTIKGQVQQLQVVNISQGNNFIADIPNAQLQKPFRQENPIAGVNEVAVTNKDENTVRITAIGETELPSVELFDSDEGLIFGFTEAEESAQTPPTENNIELVVTAEKPRKIPKMCRLVCQPYRDNKLKMLMSTQCEM